MAALLTGDTDGQIYDGAAHNANLDQIEASFDDLGPWVISGLGISAGTGLSANVALGVAFIGGRVTASVGFAIGGLAPTNTSHLYMLQNGTGTHNLTGTAPANSVKLGTATTDGSGVTSVSVTRASGRQLLVRHENLTLGGGAGHPAAGDLSSWHATNTEGNQFRGVLPAGAVPAVSAPLTLTLDDTNNATVSYPLLLRHTHSAGAGSAGIADGIQFELETGTNGTVATFGQLYVEAINPAVGNLTSVYRFRVLDNNTNVEGFRIGNNYAGVFHAPAAATDRSLMLIGAAAFTGHASGTLYGAAQDAGYAGDMINLQVGALPRTLVSSTGLLTETVYDGEEAAATAGLRVTHRIDTADTPTTGMGVTLEMRADDAAKAIRDFAHLRARGTDLTAGAVTAELDIRVPSGGTLATPLVVGPTLLTLADAVNIAVNATTGTKIGTATSAKIGFWNATPVVQPAANADTSGATLTQLETEVNEIKALLRSVGFMAP